MPGILKDIFHALTSNPFSFMNLYYYYPHFSDEEIEAQKTK